MTIYFVFWCVYEIHNAQVVIKKQAEKVAVSEEEVDIDEESEEAIEDTQEQTAPSTN